MSVASSLAANLEVSASGSGESHVWQSHIIGQPDRTNDQKETRKPGNLMG
jgi:hypothetical protein